MVAMRGNNNACVLSQSHLRKGQVLSGRWRLDRLLKTGSFGLVYVAEDMEEGSKVAIKLEPREASFELLSVELLALYCLSQRPNKHFPQLIDCGQCPSGRFIVMELLGPNLEHLLSRAPQRRFCASTTLRVAAQLVQALQQLHDSGWLHRDVKPANVCLRLGHRLQLVLIDLGMSRPYLGPDRHTPKQPRPWSPFHGAQRYASSTTHLFQEMSRGDDLQSAFYIFMEQLLGLGQLPWSAQYLSKAQVHRIKQTTVFVSLFGEAMTRCVFSIFKLQQHIRELDFNTRPDYTYLVTNIRENMQCLNVKEEDKLDWE